MYKHCFGEYSDNMWIKTIQAIFELYISNICKISIQILDTTMFTYCQKKNE